MRRREPAGVLITDGRQWRLGHVPALDGLRGMAEQNDEDGHAPEAVLIVLLGHALPEGSTLPAAGVTLFFVLSGFLITSLLVEELEARGAVDWRAFFRRRVRRLLPAFVFVWAATAVSMAFIGLGQAGIFNAVVAAAYVGNWVMASGTWLGPLSHTWSLAVEEQFYSLWPFVVLIVVPRLPARRITVLLAALAGVVIVVRVAAWIAGATSDRLAFGTDFQSDGLLIGSAVAVLLHWRAVRTTAAAAPVALGLILVTAFVLPLPLPLSAGLVAVASGTLVVALATASRPDPVLCNRYLVRLGLVSYGLYLWHYPVLWHLGFFDERPYPGVVPAVGGVGLALLAALASYRWIERPFLRRRQFDSARAPARASR